MKLQYFLPAIILALPFVSQAESEFSYDYLQFDTGYGTSEIEGTDDNYTSYRQLLGLSKELPYQIFLQADLGYLSADIKVDSEFGSSESTSDLYGYDISIGRYFIMHNRLNALISLRHSRSHSTTTYKATSKLSNSVFEGEIKDVHLTYSFDTSLRIQLDSAGRFELMPSITTTFYDEDDIDTWLMLNFGFKPIEKVQLVIGYLTIPSEVENHSITAGARWNF